VILCARRGSRSSRTLVGNRFGDDFRSGPGGSGKGGSAAARSLCGCCGHGDGAGIGLRAGRRESRSRVGFAGAVGTDQAEPLPNFGNAREMSRTTRASRRSWRWRYSFRAGHLFVSQGLDGIESRGPSPAARRRRRRLSATETGEPVTKSPCGHHGRQGRHQRAYLTSL